MSTALQINSLGYALTVDRWSIFAGRVIIDRFFGDMLFECPSKPNGDFYIMAPEDSARTYLHIVRVLLDAATGTPIDVLLRGGGITNLL